MFLPRLGLKSKLLRWPFATIALVVVTGGYGLLKQPDASAHAKQVQAIAKSTHVWTQRRLLLQQLCAQSLTGKSASTQCRYLKENLHEEDFADLSPFFKNYREKNPNETTAEFRRFQNWVSSVESYKTLDEETRKSSLVSAYATSLTIYRGELAAFAKSQVELMRGNIRFLPALKSLFLSFSFTGLFIHLLVLALFAVFLEQRVGPAGLVIMYVVGGLGANLFQSASLPFGTALIGQSGAVSSVLGAFLIYFYQEKSQFRFYFRSKAKTFKFPTWTSVVAAVFVLFLTMLFTASAETYVALTVGFALGAIMGSMEKDLFPLKKTFLFPHEQKLYYEAKNIAKFEGKMDLFRQIYQLNPESFYAFRALFVYFEKHRLSVSAFKPKDRHFVRQVLTACFTYSKKNEKYDFSHQLLGKIPLWWNLGSLELPVGANEIIDRASHFHKQGNLIQCLRCYDLFLEKYAAHARAPEAHSVIMQVFDELEKFELEPREEILQTLLLYVKAHPATHFNMQIRQLTQQIEKDRARGAA